MPTPAEVDRIVASYEKQLAHFRAHPGAATKAAQGTSTAAPEHEPGTREAGAAAEQGSGTGSSRSPPRVASHRAATAEDPERAAWTLVANALLNLDEAVNK